MIAKQTMQSASRVLLATMCTAGVAASPAFGQATGTLLASLGGKVGTLPNGALLLRPGGALYGTASQDGNKKSGLGTVFEVTPSADRAHSWTINAILTFDGKNGANPYCTLVADASGNLYGTATIGGKKNLGTVFELIPPVQGSSKWTTTVLYNFGQQGGDGGKPYGGLVFGSNGVLFGTTETLGGAASAGGTVFELSPPSQGQTAWKETVLYSFGSISDDGLNPYATLALGKKGIIFGTTRNGGTSGYGTVFKLSPPKKGKSVWKESVLYNFAGGLDGAYPYAGVIVNKEGVLFGTTVDGGSLDGTVFSLTPPAKGVTQWSEMVLADLKFNPFGGLIAGSNGVLFGTTENDGDNTAGTVYKLVPPAMGQVNWTESTVYDFGAGAQNANPVSSLIGDKSGNVFVSGLYGGDAGTGSVFELVGTGYVP